MKVCNNCGTNCQDDAQFCPECGVTFTGATSAAEYAHTQQINNQTQTHEYRVTIETPMPKPTELSEKDSTLRLIAFIFSCISLAGACWLIVPLAWMIPMTVITWGIYKGTKKNTVAFGVCMLLFVNLVSGILLLCSDKDE